jgi:hypothetical protein
MFFVALREVIAREHLRHGHAAAELEGVEERHLAEPLAVATHFGLLRIEDLVGLLEIGLGVLLDLLLGKDRTRLGLAGRIADARGVVADDEDGLVAELLELAELLEVRSGRVGSTPSFTRRVLPASRRLRISASPMNFSVRDFITFNCSAGDIPSLSPRGRGGGRQNSRFQSMEY